MNIYLVKMTKALSKQFFRDFANDPDIFDDMSRFCQYVYSEDSAEAYWQRQQDLGRVHLAVMLDGEPVGEILLKNIDRERNSCVLSIHLQNDAVKNRGYGTAAEIQAVAYAFEELGMETVYADALQKNARSRHVLEKAGFVETHQDGAFHYYKCEKAIWNRPDRF